MSQAETSMSGRWQQQQLSGLAVKRCCCLSPLQCCCIPDVSLVIFTATPPAIDEVILPFPLLLLPFPPPPPPPPCPHSCNHSSGDTLHLHTEVAHFQKVGLMQMAGGITGLEHSMNTILHLDGVGNDECIHRQSQEGC